MRHVSTPVLRRFQDEPLAVPDSARRHLAACGRCQVSGTRMAANAARAARLLAPEVICDTDLAWLSLQERLREPAAAARPAVGNPWSRPRRVVQASLGTGTLAAVGVLVVGGAAAAALTTVYAPTRVAPVQVSEGDLRAIADIAGIGGSPLTGGLPAAGSRPLAFGTLSWTSAGRARRVATIGQARAMTHLGFAGPARLPAGVGSPSTIAVQPRVTVTIRFRRGAGPVGGSTLIITAGPAMLVQYGGTAGTAGRGRLTTLAIAAMARPVATSTGATTRQIETFLLSRPGLPAGLAQEIRLLGRATLPIPVPAALHARHITVRGAPAVLIADPSGTASGIVWEGRDGIVHGVAGLLNAQDVLNVARQLG